MQIKRMKSPVAMSNFGSRAPVHNRSGRGALCEDQAMETSGGARVERDDRNRTQTAESWVSSETSCESSEEIAPVWGCGWAHRAVVTVREQSPWQHPTPRTTGSCGFVSAVA